MGSEFFNRPPKAILREVLWRFGTFLKKGSKKASFAFSYFTRW